MSHVQAHDPCPVCLSAYDAEYAHGGSGDEGFRTECGTCGDFIVTTEAYDDYLSTETSGSRWWTAPRRAALSHALRTRIDVQIERHPRHRDLPMLTSPIVLAIKNQGALLPVPPVQAQNIIRLIGNHMQKTGERYTSGPNFYALVGTPNPGVAQELVFELQNAGMIDSDPILGTGNAIDDGRLTLSGWGEWNEWEHGQRASNHGIIAMEFGDAALNSFVETVVKPAVEQIDGFSLRRIDDPEIVRAGVIDNIMREAIKECAFLLADLTHANNGAYWEAGYAEGLGKPVIYLCEESIWAQNGSHFDTNHCTTIVWQSDKTQEFAKQLTATIRNSISKRNAG